MGILDQITREQRALMMGPLSDRPQMMRGPQEAMYLGEGAQGWDPNAAAMAGLLSQGGAPPEQVRQETGYFPGPDQHMRTEMDDSGARIIMPPKLNQGALADLFKGPQLDYGAVKTLGDILHHPELYKAYPDLKDTPLTVRSDLPPNVRAGTSTETGEMMLNGDRLKDGPGPALESLLHEIQHAIQMREGFAQGSSATTEKDLALKKFLADPGSRGRFQEPSPEELYDRYRRSFGEIEARDTAARRLMSPVERQQTPPYEGQGIPPDRWIVRGQAQS